MNEADKAVLMDALLQRGLPMEAITRAIAALEPGAVVLTRKTIAGWHMAAGRGGVRFMGGEAQPVQHYHAVARADFELLERLRTATSTAAPWVPPL